MNRNVRFEREMDEYKYNIWCDLTEEQLLYIDGVDHVIQMGKHRFLINIDHRYDVDEVKTNIINKVIGTFFR